MFFRQLYGKKIQRIRIIPYDKIVYIDFENFTIISIFYGKYQNVLLTDNDHRVIETFKKDKNIAGRASEFLNMHNRPDTSAFVPKDSFEGTSISAYVQEKFPAYNKLMIHELCYRCHLKPESDLRKINSEQLELLTDTIESIQNELKKGKVYFYEPLQMPSVISLFKLHHLQDKVAVTINDNINEVWKKLIYQNQYKNTLQRILNECSTKISDRIEYLEKTHQKIANVKELEKKKKLSELKGNLLLTFSSQIHKGTDQVKLKNIYSENAEEVMIKLDPKLNVQQNANKYFQKYKNINEKKDTLKIKKETILDELKYWKKIYESIEKIDNLKKAEKLIKSLTKDTLIQPGKTTKKDKALNIFSFNRLLLDQRWEVFVGKNAQNNDILTFKFANKHDLWFHAQGVPGSHVILRSRERSQNPPMDIVEQVASIAAYYSAAQNSSTVAVDFTEVRYVRKPRKSKPGTALLTQSKTIFVQPKKYL